ncbi:MAG: OmpA family protein [Gammaproteobacteria bacterium]|nr:OmpA family protein [Gammaproteobacteria bacterium]
MKKSVLLLSLLAVPALGSADEVGQWYVNPQVGGIWVDDERLLRHDWVYGLGIGKHIHKALSLELNLNGGAINGAAALPTRELYSATLDALGVMNRSGFASPFVSLGVGALRNEYAPGFRDTDLALQAGAGLMLKAWTSSDSSRSFAVRPEFKVRWDKTRNAGYLHDTLVMLGFQFGFGGPAQRLAEAVTSPPAPAPVIAPPAPVVAAPAPPPPPADTDGDSVTDNLDQCPGTPAGVAVDTAGCPRRGSITLEGVTFEFNSDRLTEASRGVLDGIAADLRKHPRLRIELQGHTDSVGADQYNLALSQKRADAVRTHLVEQGVPAGQLQAKGYGESRPVADNATAAGRAANRRVVMLVLDNPGNVKVEGGARD